MPAVKVGTCNYCGTRAALVLRGKVRHELACGTCGAPLHDLKQMPMQREADIHHRARPATSHQRAMSREDKDRDRREKYEKPKKRRKSWKKKAFEELFDFVEDIFD